MAALDALPDTATAEDLRRYQLHLVNHNQKELWRNKARSDKGSHYLFNHRALAKVFRAKFLAALGRAGMKTPPRHPEKWVADCKYVGNREKALVYLGRYLYRGVIQEKDILRCDKGQVSFRYRDGKTGQKSSIPTRAASSPVLISPDC